MKHNLKVFKFRRLVRLISMMLLVFLLTSGFVEPQKTLLVGIVPDNVKTLLTDYSQYLNSGMTLQKSYYSSPMETLIKDRRSYYSEYYSIGMHTNLASIKSEFYLETANVTVAKNILHLDLLEIVTTFGYPIFSRAEDYPMIPAAQWAIANTDNDNVKQALKRYIASTTDAVNYSITSITAQGCE